LPVVFPPIVKVMVEVPTVEESVHVYRASAVHDVNTLMVVMFMGSLFVTEKFTTPRAPSAMLPDPFSVSPLKAMLWPVFVRTAALFRVRIPAAVTEEEREIVPAIVRL